MENKFRLRYKKIDNLIKEMKQLQEKGVEEMFFIDQTFTVNKEYTCELCQRMIDEKIKIRWSCETRIDLMDENGYEDLSVNSPDICGRISMSSVLIYPPGMPVVNVGERITGDVCRIIKAKRPKAFMLENVKNLKSHDKGNTFRVITESLDELNYEVFHAVLDGQYYVPQHRERILIIGFDRERYKGDISFSFDITPKSPKPILADILEKEPGEKYTLSDKLWTYLQNYAAKHKAAGNGFGYGLANPDGVARTLSARYYKDGSEILIPQEGKNPRRLTPRECARLQGFSDDFKIVVSDTQAYKQFGNSVVVPLMTDVAGLVVSKLQELESDR